MSENLNGEILYESKEKLIETINSAKTAEEIIEVIFSEKADDDVLDVAAKSPLIDEHGLKKIIDLVDKNTDSSVLNWVICHPKADSTIVDLVYEKAKKIDEDSPKICVEEKILVSSSVLLTCITDRILGLLPNSFLRNGIGGNEKASPELLIKIVNDTKYLFYGEIIDTLFRVTVHSNANSDVLNAVYEKIKELGSNMSHDKFQAILKKYIFNNKNTNQELLIKIINDTEDLEVIINAKNHSNADSNVFEAAYDRTKLLYNNGKTTINNFLDLIDDMLLSDVSTDKISKRLLLKIVRDSDNIDGVLGNLGVACSHKDISGEEVLVILNKIKKYDDVELLYDLYDMVPYLGALDDEAKYFESIDYKEYFNTQIAKDVAVLYINANPNKFSQEALERFSRECGVIINFDDLEKSKNAKGFHK